MSKSKNVSVIHKSGKVVRVNKIDYFQAIPTAKSADDAITVRGAQLEAASVELYQNGVDPFETINATIVPDAMVVSTVWDAGNPLGFALVAGASIEVDIIATTTGAATIDINASGVKAIEADGVPVGAGEFVAGETRKFTYNGIAWQVETKQAIATAKAVSAAAIAVQVAAAQASAVAAAASEAVITATGLNVVKVTRTFADWQPNATGQGKAIVGIPLPAGASIVDVKIKHSIPFQGGTLAMANLTLKNGIEATPAANVFQAVGDTVLVSGPAQASITKLSHAVASSLDVNLDVGAGTIDQLMQGSVDIWVYYFVGV